VSISAVWVQDLWRQFLLQMEPEREDLRSRRVLSLQWHVERVIDGESEDWDCDEVTCARWGEPEGEWTGWGWRNKEWSWMLPEWYLQIPHTKWDVNKSPNVKTQTSESRTYHHRLQTLKQAAVGPWHAELSLTTITTVTHYTAKHSVNYSSQSVNRKWSTAMENGKLSNPCPTQNWNPSVNQQKIYSVIFTQ